MASSAKPCRRGSFSIQGLILGLAGIVLISGVARSCALGTVGLTKKTRLTFWNGFTGPDGVVMLKMIEEFNAANPDIEVSMQRIPWATYYNKLTVAGSDGRGPDIFISHADAIGRIRRSGFMADVSGIYERAINLKDFDPYVTNFLRYQGRYYGVPLDVHPQGAYCNADMLKEAGIVDAAGNARPPRDKADFMRVIQLATQEADAKHPDKRWGFAFTYWGANFRSMVPQFGGRFLDAEGNAVFNSPQNIAALTFLGDLAKRKLAPPPDNQLGWVGFRTGKVAMVWDGIFMLGDLLRVAPDFKYVGAPVPQIGPKPGTTGNSHVFCINSHLDTDRNAKAERFVKYISDHSITWSGAGQVPARLSIRNSPEFKAMQVQHAFSIDVPRILYPPKSPKVFELVQAMDLAVESVIRGNASPKDALDRANKTAQDVITRDREEFPEDQP